MKIFWSRFLTEGQKAWVQSLGPKLGSKTCIKRLFNDDDHAHGCVRVHGHGHGHDDGDVQQHEL